MNKNKPWFDYTTDPAKRQFKKHKCSNERYLNQYQCRVQPF